MGWSPSPSWSFFIIDMAIHQKTENEKKKKKAGTARVQKDDNELN